MGARTGYILVSSLTCCTEYEGILLGSVFFAEDLQQWQATLSQVDLKWTEEQFNQLFRRKLYDRVTFDDLEKATREYQSTMNTDPKKWTFDKYVIDSVLPKIYMF